MQQRFSKIIRHTGRVYSSSLCGISLARKQCLHRFLKVQRVLRKLQAGINKKGKLLSGFRIKFICYECYSSGIYKLLEERDTPVTLTIRGFVGELNTSPGSDQEHNTPTTCHTWYSPFRWAHHFQLMRLLFEVLGSEAAFTPQALHVFSRE